MNLKLPSTENSRADFHEVLSGIQITTFFSPPTFLKGCKDAVEFGEKTEVLGYCQFSPLNSAEQDNMISEGTMANIFNKKQGHAPLIYTHAQSHISIHRATFKSIHIVCSS